MAAEHVHDRVANNALQLEKRAIACRCVKVDVFKVSNIASEATVRQ
jgi:hypothetical protein